MIFCIILAIIVLIAWLVITVICFIDDIAYGFCSLFGGLFIAGLINFFLIGPFVALDRSNGTSIGVVTAVDKNFFGTYTLYIKATETTEDKFCIEDKKIVEQSKELIGKKVQLYYGQRVGLYHLNECREAPVEKIELFEE